MYLFACACGLCLSVCVCVFQLFLACEQLALKSLNVCILMPLSSRLMRDLVDYADACVISVSVCLHLVVPRLLVAFPAAGSTPHSFSSVAFRTVQISRLPFIFCALLLLFLLLFSSSLCPLLYARV